MATRSSFKYNNLFYLYYTSEGLPFTLKNRSIAFPEDDNNPIYKKMYISNNTPWTVLSHTLYNTVDYWWVLAALNKSQVFYAKEGTEILTIPDDYIDSVISTIKEQMED